MKKFIYIINRDIPGGMWTFVISLLVVWHMGTEAPYANRHLLGWTVNQMAAQMEIKYRTYSTRYFAAYAILNPPKPCFDCLIATHKMLEARKRALSIESQLEKRNCVTRAPNQIQYP